MGWKYRAEIGVCAREGGNGGDGRAEIRGKGCRNGCTEEGERIIYLGEKKGTHSSEAVQAREGADNPWWMVG